jgi:CDP-diacylglycerol--glycerol-3-phosphate 3-phosphatidyltransferase
MNPVKKRWYYIVNGITYYRLLVAPVLVYFIFHGDVQLFGILLAISFSTDAVDGYLARKFGVISVFGAKLDSIADDLTILTAVLGLFVLKLDFIKDQLPLVIILLGLFAIQNIMAFVRYKKITSFHTYSAKVAAVFQGTFLILIFLLPEPFNLLFYVAAFTTIIDLIEEIILVLVIPKWKANVKGLYWVLKKRK